MFVREKHEVVGAGGEDARGERKALLHPADLEVRDVAAEREAKRLSVRLELQADCYAGVWGASASRRGLLEPGDVEALDLVLTVDDLAAIDTLGLADSIAGARFPEALEQLTGH